MPPFFIPSCTEANKIGVWPGAKPKWEAFTTLTKPAEAASDQAAVWVDLRL